MIEVNGHNCTDCAHEAVCCHKANFIDIRREFLEVANNDYDIVSEIAVKCRHYCTKAITTSNISPITNPYYNNFTSVTSSASSNTSNYTDLQKSLNYQTPGYYADKED